MFNKKEYTKQYLREWRKHNRERVRMHERRFYQNNKEKVLDWNREFRKNHPDYDKKLYLRRKKYRQSLEYKVKRATYDQKWSRTHREYRNYQDMIRRMRLRKVKGSFTLQDWQDLEREYNYTCSLCGRKEPEIKLTIDHIIPISKGGTNEIKNIQPLCINCNSKKGGEVLTNLYGSL